MRRAPVSALCHILAFGLAQNILGQNAASSTAPSAGPITGRIPIDQIGNVVSKQYSGDGLAVEFVPEGARLRCSFQKLNGQVTTEGLWLASAADGAKGERFRVIARTLGRESAETLLATGKVVAAGQVARFIRPGLTEECSVGVDGVRQDFVIEQRPEGTGLVRLGLEVDGAKAATIGDGARLVLADRGRKLVYNRLKAEDARGREVKATMKVVSANRLTVVLEDTAAEYPIRIDPTFSDANWISMNPGIPGADGPLNAAVVDGSGNLYIGGFFTVVGNVIANDIAKWDGTSWTALSSGMNGRVSALAVSGTKLYAGGYFTTAGGSTANGIAQWDGNSWSTLGSGVDGQVLALAVSGSSVYAGGSFSTAGGIAATNMAQWNGSSWTALGSGIDGQVLALAVSGSDVYAGGLFKTAGGIAATNIAEWNGSTWSALGTGINIGVEALAVSGSDLYVGGGFTTAGGIPASNIAKWNGSSWSALGSGINGTGVQALVVSGISVYAGGHFTKAGGLAATNIAQWNGSSWSVPGSGMDSTVFALAVSGANVYAGGSFTTAGGIAANDIAQWDGNSWSPLASIYGMNRQVLALTVSGTNVYAGGQFTTTGSGATNNYIAEWNGNSWTMLGLGMDSQVLALAASGTNLYAGGSFRTAGGGAALHIARWDGSAWSALGSGVAGTGQTVDSLAVSGTNLYVGGSFTTAGGIAATNIAEWNGSSWSALGPGLAGGFAGTSLGVYALAVSGTNLYAGGNFTTAGGSAVTNIAKWDGSSWTPVGSGSGMGPTFPSVVALAVSGTNLYAGGVFTMADGVAANYIAKWNGSNWTPLGLGLNSTVSALAASGSDLYAGGVFTTAGGSPANYIAQWDGSSWTALGSGANSPVAALAVSGSDLYVGGYFGTAGGKVSPYIARFSLVTLPTVSMIFSGANVIVRWPTNATGFTLQSTTNLNSPVVWITNSPAPAVVNGQNAVTNLVSGGQKFYRLIQ